MLIACWSPKGGSGTTVVSVALAVVMASRSQPAGALVADLRGDVPAVLGLPEPSGPGVADWLRAGDDVPSDALARLEVDVGGGLRLLPCGREDLAPAPSAYRAEALTSLLNADRRPVVADCGPPAGHGLALITGAAISLLVLRPCYLALKRAVASPIRPTGVILITEPRRSLDRRDVEDVLGVPVRAEVVHDPSVARLVDAGLLASRLPRSLERALESAA